MNTRFVNVELVRNFLKHLPSARKKKNLYISDFKPELLENAVRRAIRDVPFYKDYDKYIEDGFDIKKLPIITKANIQGHSSELVSKRIPSWRRVLKGTSGSTGLPLDVYYSPKIFFEKDIIVNSLFDSFGKHLRIGILRGDRVKGDGIVSYKGCKKWVFSSYRLCEAELDKYIDEMKRLRINVLHVYPSAVTVFARLIKKRYGVSPLNIKGIFSSSESFDPNDKRFVMSVFPDAKFIDGFGQNELCCFGSAEGMGHFRFYQNYGYCELRPTGEKTPAGNDICEIVATSIMNTTMPFIRYATRDNVEVDSQGNILRILGRSSDFVVNTEGQLQPCIFLESPGSLENVTNFQFWQPEKGVMIFRVVVNKEFTESERRQIVADLSKSFGASMRCDCQIVDAIAKGKNGKQKRLQQDIDIDPFRKNI